MGRFAAIPLSEQICATFDANKCAVPERPVHQSISSSIASAYDPAQLPFVKNTVGKACFRDTGGKPVHKFPILSKNGSFKNFVALRMARRFGPVLRGTASYFLHIAILHQNIAMWGPDRSRSDPNISHLRPLAGRATHRPVGRSTPPGLSARFSNDYWPDCPVSRCRCGSAWKPIFARLASSYRSSIAGAMMHSWRMAT